MPHSNWNGYFRGMCIRCCSILPTKSLQPKLGQLGGNCPKNGDIFEKNDLLVPLYLVYVRARRSLHHTSRRLVLQEFWRTISGSDMLAANLNFSPCIFPKFSLSNGSSKISQVPHLLVHMCRRKLSLGSHETAQGGEEVSCDITW